MRDWSMSVLEHEVANGRVPKMLHDRVLVERLPEEYHGVIFIPDAHKPKSLLAKVLAVGPGRETEDGWLATCVRPGDTVVIGPYEDYEGYEGRLAVIQEGDIRAIVSNA